MTVHCRFRSAVILIEGWKWINGSGIARGKGKFDFQYIQSVRLMRSVCDIIVNTSAYALVISAVWRTSRMPIARISSADVMLRFGVVDQITEVRLDRGCFEMLFTTLSYDSLTDARILSDRKGRDSQRAGVPSTLLMMSAFGSSYPPSCGSVCVVHKRRK